MSIFFERFFKKNLRQIMAPVFGKQNHRGLCFYLSALGFILWIKCSAARSRADRP